MTDSSAPNSNQTFYTARSTQEVSSSSTVQDRNVNSTTSSSSSVHSATALRPITNYPNPSSASSSSSPPLPRLISSSSSPSPHAPLPSSSASANVQIQAGPSPTQIRRTPEEIQANKKEAERRRAVKEREGKAAARKAAGSESLMKYGFGSKKRAGDTRENPKQPEEIGNWKPDERCSKEQLEVLEQVEEGGNIFFTGSAGVGKSFLLQEIARLLSHLGRSFELTATTGIAALGIGGRTIHSWASIGILDKPIYVLYDRLTQDKEKKQRWLTIRTLVIDEISMSSPQLFETLNILGKLIRQNNAPFGGIQIIVCGDFYQLPPVPESKVPHQKCVRCGGLRVVRIPIEEARVAYEERPEGVDAADVWKCVEYQGEAACSLEKRKRQFVFETDSWYECQFQVMELTTVFRQSDQEFIKVLEKIRRGVCDEDCVELLKRCGTDLKKDGEIGIKPTNLNPLKKEVENENKIEFKALPGKIYTFEALDEARGSYAQGELRRLDNVPAPPRLELKTGAQVLLLANLSVKGGLVNGSRGAVVDWIPANEIPEEYANQGFPDGQDDIFMEEQAEQFFPLVYFSNETMVMIRPHTWSIELDRENRIARTQIPLQLAWALTVHKAQGQSLDAVGVRLRSCFTTGQAYVALSRARTMGGLHVDGFTPDAVKVDKTVKIFYECIAKKKPFFLSPPAPVHPLVYIPDSNPIIDTLKDTYGPVPRPLEVGSAILLPGQRKAGNQVPAQIRQRPPPRAQPRSQSGSGSSSRSNSQSSSQSNHQSRTSTASTSSEENPLLPPPPKQNTQKQALPSSISSSSSSPIWKKSLEQAVREYVESIIDREGGGEGDGGPGLGSDGQVEFFMVSAGLYLKTTLGKRLRNSEEEVKEEEDEDLDEDPSMMEIDQEDGGSMGNSSGQHKKKKKRARKGRVGH